MTTKQKLKLMEEIRKNNEMSIRNLLQKGPITSRRDPRYRFKVAKQNLMQTIEMSAGDGVAMVLGISAMLIFPALLMFVIGM